MQLTELEVWLTPTDAAKVLGVSRQMVEKRLNDGRYRAVRTRQGWLIDPKSVEGAKKRG